METEIQYSIRVIGGKQYLFLNDEKLPCQISTQVSQDTEQSNFGLAIVTVTVMAHLVDTINPGVDATLRSEDISSYQNSREKNNMERPVSIPMLDV